MVTTYHAIYLSPHLDDVALSCGGQVFQRTRAGERILIVTLTAGDMPETAVSRYAYSLHQRWALITNTIAGRRKEDKAACRIIGADFLHWDIPDCIYRTDATTGKAFYVSDEAVFGAIHPLDRAQLLDQLLHQMRQLPATNEIYSPLGIGNHVDHQLTRMAAEAVFFQNLYYYEDYPYAQKPNALHTVMPVDRFGWQSKIVPLSKADTVTRIDAIAAFTSQFSTFFIDQADLEQQITSYVSQVGGERIWVKCEKG